MKKIAIVYNNMDNSSAITHIEQEIEKVFAGEVMLDHYYIDQMKAGDHMSAASDHSQTVHTGNEEHDSSYQEYQQKTSDRAPADS